uniref:Uncharacterized protein n=1 Tax=Anguilla anguilla TaxID=7936 RepID=A0A0E9VQ27_ANGAN
MQNGRRVITRPKRSCDHSPQYWPKWH